MHREQSETNMASDETQRSQGGPLEGQPPATAAGGQPTPEQSAAVTFMQRLRDRWEQGRTLLCVGLDPELERLPRAVRGGQTGSLALDPEHEDAQAEEALISFNRAIVDATADLACAFKPNAAFYEACGISGYRALIRTIAYIHQRYPEVPVILDAKRGDVGSTSAAYARAVFDVCGADAVTLHPYLGAEAVAPFLERADKGAFVLCRTSNPGAGEFQDLRFSSGDQVGPIEQPPDEPLYLRVAQRVAQRVAGAWNARGNCGLVVGATYPAELRRVRARAGDLPLLVPGIGAQGGSLEATLEAGLDSHGQGLVISASRSILYASDGRDFAEAARREAQRLWHEIDRLRG